MSEKKRFIHSLIFPLLFLILIWLNYMLFIVIKADMTLIGIKPLTLKGIPGILLSPFAHGSIKHILSNSISFFVLSTLLFYFYRQIAYRVFFLNWIISGTLLWIGGRELIHIGASGLIYGLAFFIFFSGFFRKEKSFKAISFIVILFYGGMVWGMIPQNNNISWEGHLFGAMSGFSLAWYYRKSPLEINNDLSNTNVTWGDYDSYKYEYFEDK